MVYYFLLLTAVSIYSFGYALELKSVHPADILKNLRIEYIGISYRP